MTSDQLIRKSIEYHDPKGQWNSFIDTLYFRQELPNDQERIRVIFIDRKNNNFSFKGDLPEGVLRYEVRSDNGTAYWNNSKEFPDTIRTKYRISNDRALLYRDYYSYLYGMPMKLNDPGTNIDPLVEEVTFHDKEYYKIKVTYSEEVGSDTWYFYFDKNNYGLGAYEFWKEEPGDGEYLLLNGVKILNGIKLPRNISWYMTIDDRWLATDILE
jgi:hypothetical protein